MVKRINEHLMELGIENKVRLTLSPTGVFRVSVRGLDDRHFSKESEVHTFLDGVMFLLDLLEADEDECECEVMFDNSVGTGQESLFPETPPVADYSLLYKRLKEIK